MELWNIMIVPIYDEFVLLPFSASHVVNLVFLVGLGLRGRNEDEEEIKDWDLIFFKFLFFIFFINLIFHLFNLKNDFMFF